MRVAVQLALSTVALVESAHGTETGPGGQPIIDQNGDRWRLGAPVVDGDWHHGILHNERQAAYDRWDLLVWWNREMYGRDITQGGKWFKRVPSSGGWYGWGFSEPTGDPRTGEPPPPPVDCVLSEWSEWSAWAVSPTDPLVETRARTRIVITPPSNGGAACGPLTESELRAIAQTNRAPTWNMTDLIFEQGVPAQIDLRTRATDPDGDPLTFNVETALAADLIGPFSFNDFTLYYDGRDMGLLVGSPPEPLPPLILDSGITISADDGR